MSFSLPSRAAAADLLDGARGRRLLTYKAALEKDAGKTFSLAAAQAKLKTGGYGYIEEYPVCTSTATPRSSPSARGPTRSSR